MGWEKWTLLTADVQAAFLKGEFHDKVRVLYCWPPKNGSALPGVQPGSLLLILKVVFGSTGTRSSRVQKATNVLRPFHVTRSCRCVEWRDLSPCWWHVGNWRWFVWIETEGTRQTRWIRFDETTEIRSPREAVWETSQWRNHDFHEDIHSEFGEGMSDSWTPETIGWRAPSNGQSWVPRDQWMFAMGNKRVALPFLVCCESTPTEARADPSARLDQSKWGHWWDQATWRLHFDLSRQVCVKFW